ncbi:TetR/AcrR family transcriptional regulator [Dictyobacter arantiisoli]|uniref:TetR family transcriptional regulator n=1 Tax=Dictyobacter arantiisoli TaxID=2014874 RepID=A0A5A5TCG7_9CHLR|nr:TetR/AcrR family transcriptional regulator [Dictyobacter arantiisoli]GCF08644.1 TetR family transcriptional regulator [Dictyobacter arantiisoli]
MRTWSEDHPKARLLERKQGAIKVAAKELFLRHGYANTTMEMVAAQAGVSIMTLYRHFRGKDVLFQAVIQHLCSQKAKEGKDMFWQGNPAEVLHRLGQLRLAYALNPEEIALYQVILGAMEHFPEVGRMYYQLSVEKALDRLSAYFQELDRHGSLHIPDPRLSAQVFLTLLQGQIIERARLGAGSAPTNEEIEHHIDACVTFFLTAHHANRPD